jgi:hypothetical protein
MSDLDHASEFWNWFASYASEVRDAYRRNDHHWLATNISLRIKRIADRLNWEIGPYREPDNTFVLSPTIRENLPITRSTIAMAPKLKGWHFLHAKPPKELLSLEISAHNCTINADTWQYRLTSYNNGEFVDIEIFINAAPDFPTAYQDLFCELAVESLIGEECRLDRVGYLIPTIVVDNTSIPNLTAIQHLKKHLDLVLTPSQVET